MHVQPCAGFTIRRTPRERSGQARHQRPVTRVNVWSVLAEWTTAIVALALLAFYYFALGSATNADRSESSYMLLSAPSPSPRVPAARRSAYPFSPASWSTSISTFAPLERAPAHQLADAVGPPQIRVRVNEQLHAGVLHPHNNQQDVRAGHAGAQGGVGVARAGACSMRPSPPPPPISTTARSRRSSSPARFLVLRSVPLRGALCTCHLFRWGLRIGGVRRGSSTGQA